MRYGTIWILLVLVVGCPACCGEAASDQPVTNKTPELTKDKRFWVYEDSHCNLWKPANWMPEEASQMIEPIDVNCETNPQSGKRCIHIRIAKWTAPYWCGVAWAVPHPKDPGAGYWGVKPAPAWDLRGAKRVVFWGRAPKKCRVRFKVCICVDQPHGDSAADPAATPWLLLSPEWKQFTLDLKGVDLSRVISGFCFVTNRDAQSESDAPVEFYLDNIYWDFAEPEVPKPKDEPGE